MHVFMPVFLILFFISMAQGGEIVLKRPASVNRDFYPFLKISFWIFDTVNSDYCPIRKINPLKAGCTHTDNIICRIGRNGEKTGIGQKSVD